MGDLAPSIGRKANPLVLKANRPADAEEQRRQGDAIRASP